MSGLLTDEFIDGLNRRWHEANGGAEPPAPDRPADTEAPAPEQAGACPRCEALREALTPSPATKYAYIGEFSFNVTEADGRTAALLVPWTTIKEIMAAIRRRAEGRP